MLLNRAKAVPHTAVSRRAGSANSNILGRQGLILSQPSSTRRHPPPSPQYARENSPHLDKAGSSRLTFLRLKRWVSLFVGNVVFERWKKGEKQKTKKTFLMFAGGLPKDTPNWAELSGKNTSHCHTWGDFGKTKERNVSPRLPKPGCLRLSLTGGGRASLHLGEASLKPDLPRSFRFNGKKGHHLPFFCWLIFKNRKRPTPEPKTKQGRSELKHTTHGNHGIRSQSAKTHLVPKAKNRKQVGRLLDLCLDFLGHGFVAGQRCVISAALHAALQRQQLALLGPQVLPEVPPTPPANTITRWYRVLPPTSGSLMRSSNRMDTNSR